MDIDLAYTYRRTKPLHPGRPGYLQNVIMWACRRWRTCKYLRIHCPLLVTNKNAAGLPSLIMEIGPVNVTTLELSAGKETNAGCLFEALLASVQIHNQLEMLQLSSAVQRIPELSSLKHLRLEDVQDDMEIGRLVAPLACLEILDLSGTACTPRAKINLRRMQRLQQVMLHRVIPVALELPPNCRVSIFGGVHVLLDACWRDCPDRMKVDIISIDQYYIADRYQAFSFLRTFPNLEVLDVDSLLFVSSPLKLEFDLTALPPLTKLSCLRLVSHRPCFSGPSETLEVVIPGHVPLKRLILHASNIIMKLESPETLSTTLHEMIFAAHTYQKAQSERLYPMMGGDFFRLLECCMQRGGRLHTGLCHDEWDYVPPYSRVNGFLYVINQLSNARSSCLSSKELFLRRFACLCGNCWCCKFVDGDRSILSPDFQYWHALQDPELAA